jgi:hypothetical protein
VGDLLEQPSSGTEMTGWPAPSRTTSLLPRSSTTVISLPSAAPKDTTCTGTPRAWAR